MGDQSFRKAIGAAGAANRLDCKSDSDLICDFSYVEHLFIDIEDYYEFI